jgi:predicted ATP-binding protein involved in virulence
MRIERIDIENFRLFDKRSFSFHPEFNLVVGVNSTGKTSLLKAVCKILTKMPKRLEQDEVEYIEHDDVRLVSHKFGRLIRFERQYPTIISAVLARNSGIEKTALVQVDKTSDEQDDVDFVRIYNDALENGVSWFQYPLDDAPLHEPITLPVVAFYPCHRLWRTNAALPTTFDAATERDSRFSGYAKWHDASADYSNFRRWVIGKTLERMEELLESDSIPSFEHFGNELDWVNQAVAACLENAEQIRYDFKLKSLRVDWSTGESSPFELLSDGQRVTLAMVADIARRACLLNPHLSDKALEETPGIVLVDELDLHLHPKWQRRIIEDLRRTFPKIQFICTTHSPFLIQALRSGEELVVLDGQPPAQAGNLSLEEIARGVMGVANPQVSLRYADMKAAARHYLETLEEAAMAPEEKLAAYKDRLAEAIGPYADNPAFQAFLEMKRAAKLGE